MAKQSKTAAWDRIKGLANQSVPSRPVSQEAQSSGPAATGNGPASTEEPVQPQRESVPTPARAHVSTSIEEPTTPAGFKVRRPRVEKPHQSVYAHPAVFKVLRRIAEEEGDGKKPQDLYREGLRYVLAKRGYDFDKLDRGEV